MMCTTWLILAALLGLGAAELIMPCYITNFAQYRSGIGRYVPENYQPGLCTHVFFGFGTISNVNGIALPSDPGTDLTHHNKTGLYERVNDLKAKQPGLKTVLSFGGPVTEPLKWSHMASNATRRATFISTALGLVKSYGFNGIDLMWNYPTSVDKAHFTLLVQELKAAAGDLLVTAAVSGKVAEVVDNYDAKALSLSLDFINVLSFDYSTPNDRKVGPSAPMASAINANDVLAGLHIWHLLGFNKSQILMGVATYYPNWILANSNNNNIGSFGSLGVAYPITNMYGYGAYYEICAIIPQARRFWAVTERVPYMVFGNLWLSYEDAQSIANKMEFVHENGYRGAFIANLDLDDFTGQCPGHQQYPIASAVKYGLFTAPTTSKPTEAPATQSSVPVQPFVPTQAPATTKPAPARPLLATTKNPLPFVPPSPAPYFYCPHRGYYVDKVDCSKFYWCSDDGRAWLMVCPSQTFWDAAKQSCNHSPDGKCFQ